jgi:eukaryotic-like serine/threonine-protein kinase
VTLSAGTRLGPYEILSPIGAGGMGEVYKAKDTRLGRDVAIKVLPEEFARDPERLRRFEGEARSASAISDPHIVTVFDVGREGETSYIASELVVGSDLRAHLGEPVPLRKILDLAEQIASGLAAAHEKGITHRDLKPENILITKSGQAKIADFGLAKLTEGSGGDDSQLPTSDGHSTAAGVVMGTVAYMSPEQARGGEIDFRSDQFAFGAIAYEMLTGKKAFHRGSVAETFAAVLREEPPMLGSAAPGAPAPLRWVVERCLAKDREMRFASTHDLHRDLQAIREHLSEAVSLSEPALPLSPQNRRTTRLRAVLSVLALVGAALAGWALRGRAAPPPTFRPLTHQRGTVTGARFVPNSPEVIYSAQWSGAPSQWYALRLDQPGTRTLAGSEGILLSVSASGEGLGTARTYLSHGAQVGSLYSLPLAGGAPRESVSSSVWGASQGAQAGEVAAVIGDYGGENRLEWPLGHVVRKGLDTLRSPRIHGDHVAYFREVGDTLEGGALELVDRAGKVRLLARVPGFTGMAWGPGGKEIWVSSYRDGESRFLAVDLSGKGRTLLHHAGRLEIQDVDAVGNVLVGFHSYQRQTFARAAGESRDRDFGWLDAQATLSLSGDGRLAIMGPLGEWSLVDGMLYLRPLTGEPAQALGLGQCQPTISRDGKWVGTCVNEPTFSVLVIPTGPGASRRVPVSGFTGTDLRVDILPGGKTALLWGRRQGEAVGFHTLDLETGIVKKASAPGASPFAFQSLLSPDSRWIAFVQLSGPTKGENPIAVSHPDGTEAHVVMTLDNREAIAGWGPDSASLYVWDRNKVPADVDRVDLTTKRRTRVMTLQPPDPVGISGIPSLLMTPDGRAYTYNVVRKLSELYLVEGLR